MIFYRSPPVSPYKCSHRRQSSPARRTKSLMRRNFSSAQCPISEPQFQHAKPSQYSQPSLMPDLSLAPGRYSTMSASPSPVMRPGGEDRQGCPPGRRQNRERIISRNMNGTSKYFVSPAQCWPSNLTSQSQSLFVSLENIVDINHS